MVNYYDDYVTDILQFYRSTYHSSLERESIISKLLFIQNSIFHNKPLTSFHIERIIHDYPQFFGLNLIKVIAPRYGYLRQKNRTFSEEELISQSCRILKNMFTLADEEFCQFFTLTENITDFAEFRKEFWQGGLSAVRNMNLPLVDTLIDLGWSSADDMDRNGRSVLMWACSLGKHASSLEMVKLLVEKADERVFHRSINGDTCLHWAATGHSLDVCKYLVSKGLDVSVVNNELSSPLHWAAGSDASDVFDWLLELLMSVNSDVNYLEMRNIFGCTVAHFASSGGCLNMCEKLHNLGADMKAQNFHGHDALTKAVAFNRNHIVAWLLNNVDGIRDTLHDPRPWIDDTSITSLPLDCPRISLIEIASKVHNYGAMKLLEEVESLRVVEA
jgi:ankyrin repeat protein